MTDVAAPKPHPLMPDRTIAARLREWIEPAGTWLYGFLAVSLVAGSTGGYLSTTQGWAAVTTLWLATVVALVRNDLRIGSLECLFLGGLTAFTCWTALSAFWSPTVTSTMHEVQRNLAYVGIAAAGVVIVRQRTVPHLLGGVLAAVTLLSTYALGTRLLPDRVGDFDSESFGYRLATPITYWNGLGIFAVMGILLALGFAVRSRTLATRGLAAAAIPLLACTMYFTFSRGAWVALAIGLVVTAVVDPRRLQLIAGLAVLAPWTTLALAAAHDRPGLTTRGSTFGEAIDDGHSLVLPLVLLALGSGVAALAFAMVERRVPIPRSVRSGFAVIVASCLVLAGAFGIAREGGPWTAADRAWTQFNAPPKATGDNQSDRLLQLSSTGRVSLWKTSWQSFEDEPLSGTGAGTFWQEWAASPNYLGASQEGHSLYAEVLGEMGLPGLLLLVAALGVPAVAGVRGRSLALAAPAFGAYAAWLVHAGVDWDWELAGVGAVAMLTGAALLRSREPAGDAGYLRPALAVTCLTLSLAALVGLLGDEAIRSASKALGRGDTAQALSDLDRAERWAPWSSQPDELRANVYIEQGKKPLAAAAYRDAIAKDEQSWLLWSALASVSTGAAREQALAEAARLNPPHR